jgi:hypothetical protein
VVLTVENSSAQKPIKHFEVDQCDTIEFSVVDWPGDRYTWDLYRDSTVNFAQVNGDVDPVAYFADNGNPPKYYEGSTVQVINLDPGRYFLRVMVWDEVQCTNNLLVFLIDVLENLPVATLEGDSVCIGEPAVIKIILTGMGPWDVKYTYGDGTNIINLNGITQNEYTIPAPLPMPVGKTDFWVMEVVEDNGVCRIVNSTPSEKVGVLIYPKPKNSKIYLKE